MPVFAEALDNIAKNYIHTQEGRVVINYRLIPLLDLCLLNLIGLLNSKMIISHCIVKDYK